MAFTPSSSAPATQSAPSTRAPTPIPPTPDSHFITIDSPETFQTPTDVPRIPPLKLRRKTSARINRGTSIPRYSPDVTLSPVKKRGRKPKHLQNSAVGSRVDTPRPTTTTRQISPSPMETSPQSPRQSSPIHPPGESPPSPLTPITPSLFRRTRPIQPQNSGSPPVKESSVRYSAPSNTKPDYWSNLPEHHFHDLNDCPHSTSFMPPLFPQKIIDNPYHSTMLTLLRQITTLPCDLVSPALPASSRHRLKIYACYQQHWNPKINMPILTLVAPCGTSIMPPTMRRKSPMSVDLEFTASTEHQQEYFALNIPLLMTHTVTSSSVILTSGPANNFPDTYTSYVIKAADPQLNLLWIKVFQMSVSGCATLHTHSIYSPPRPAAASEIHILGISGIRTAPYSITQVPLEHNMMKFLSYTDLTQLGYKHQQTPNEIKNKFKINKEILTTAPPALIHVQSTPQGFFKDNQRISVSTPLVIPVTVPHLVPIHYPAPKVLSSSIKLAPPTLLFSGTENTLTVRRQNRHTSLEKCLSNLVVPTGETPESIFYKLFNVSIGSLELYNKEISLQHFLDKQLRNHHNGSSTFNTLKSFQEPYRVHFPRSWIYLVAHPTLKLEAQGTNFPATEDHDWPEFD